MSKKGIITVWGTQITVVQKDKEDYLCLTDIANAKE
jgi:hypothetical protein